MPEPTTPLAERPWENVERMLDVDAALERILDHFAPLPPEEVQLSDAHGRVLAADVVAADNVPPFRNSAMDGYAVHSADIHGADWRNPAELPVCGHVAAGAAHLPHFVPGHALRIMTGAPLPAGVDSVVRFEETDEGGGNRGTELGRVKIYRPTVPGDNVREAGEDIAAGAVVARGGRKLGPADVGILASVGQAMVAVHRRPTVAILSTGNEVVLPGRPLMPGEIRDSNSYVLGAMASAWGANVRILGIARDSVSDLTGRLAAARDADLIVTSGGVSLGDFDFVKDVLQAEGDVAIWQVRMKPGKPLAFGTIGGTPLLGLPGNPVAAAVSFLLFGRPAILRMLGHLDVGPPLVSVITAEELDNRGKRRHFARVLLEHAQDGTIVARSVGEQGAGVLSSLAAADALLIVPEELDRVPAGTGLRAIPLAW